MNQEKGGWGFDLDGMDLYTSPQDNFFQYANGAWLAKIVIPDDRARWGSFFTLARENHERLRIILDELVSAQHCTEEK